MKSDLSEFEQLLLELVHFLSYDKSLTVKQVGNFLRSKVDGKRTVLLTLRSRGREFLNELKVFINESV